MKHLWLIAVLVSMLLMRSAHASEPVEPQLPRGLCTTFRHQYGAESAQQAAQLLGYPCHHNWIADSYGVPGHTKTAYSLRPSALPGYVADANDNEFWLVGSEPNIGATHIEPSDASIFTSAWVTQTNTTWACCGTLQHFEHGYLLDWLDSYLAAGGVIPDAWHIHIYFVDNAGWDATLAQFETWMERNNVVRPVLVTETAQTNGNAEPLLRHVAKVVCDERVQAIYWYIGDKDAYDFAPSSQLTIDGKITDLGKLFVGLRDCPPVEPTDDDVVGQPVQPWRVWLPGAYR